MNTIEKFRTRPARLVAITGAGDVPIRDLTLGELRAIDARAERAPEGERGILRALLLVGYALAEPDGSPCYPGVIQSDLDEIEALLTIEQIQAIGSAVMGADAGKG